MKKFLLSLFAVTACSTQDLTPHLLAAEPGCWLPESPAPSVGLDVRPSLESDIDTFAQMMAATQQVAELQTELEVQRLVAIVDQIRASPDADAWSVEPAIGSSGSGLSGGEDAGVVTGSAEPGTGTPGTYGASGSLTIPGRDPSMVASRPTGDPLRIDAKLIIRGAERVDIGLTIIDLTCSSASVCTPQTVVGRIRVTPSLSVIDLPTQIIAWNDDFVSIRPRFTASAVPFHRGCDPATGVSFELRVGSVNVKRPSLEPACWDAAGATTSCAGVDLTPGI